MSGASSIKHTLTYGIMGEDCCRPVTLLEGKGLVCPCPSPGLENPNHSCLSGKSSLRFRVYHPQGTVLNHVSLCCPLNEVITTARTRQARTILHHVYRVRGKYCIRCSLPRGLGNGECPWRTLPWVRIHLVISNIAVSGLEPVTHIVPAFSGVRPISPGTSEIMGVTKIIHQSVVTHCNICTPPSKCIQPRCSSWRTVTPTRVGFGY